MTELVQSLEEEVSQSRHLALHHWTVTNHGLVSTGVANAAAASLDRRERLRKLALETIDLNKVRFLAAIDASNHPLLHY